MASPSRVFLLSILLLGTAVRADKPAKAKAAPQIGAPEAKTSPPASLAYAELNRPQHKGTSSLQFQGFKLFGFSAHGGYDSEVFAELVKDKYSWANDSVWKAHLSINPNQVGKAWDIAYPLLIAGGIDHFKVIRQSAAATKGVKLYEHLLKGDLTEQEVEIGTTDLLRLHGGAQITIYLTTGKEDSAPAVFKKVEAALAKAKVGTGAVPASDRAIGKYTSIRYDGGPMNYKPHDGANGYKPDDVKDPFKPL